MNTSKTNNFPKSRAGFSLVEVTIALGILAFAGVTILGLLPAAMTMLQDTTMDTVASRIASETAADLQQVELGEGSFRSVKAFDQEGREVAMASTDAVFVAYVSDRAHNLPGSGAQTLRRVTLQVVQDPGRRVNVVDADGFATIPSGTPSRSFQFYVYR